MFNKKTITRATKRLEKDKRSLDRWYAPHATPHHALNIPVPDTVSVSPPSQSPEHEALRLLFEKTPPLHVTSFTVNFVAEPKEVHPKMAEIRN